MQIKKYLARLKNKLFAKPFIRDERYPAYWFDRLLGDKAAFVVQIGSNDGKTGDPLHQLFQKNTQWKGLLVEPIPYLFKRLSANYQDRSRYQLEQVAINEGLKMPFYWVDARAKEHLPDLPYWFDQLGSFNEGHIIKELGESIKPYLLSQELEGITLANLLVRNRVAKIDILHIDAEGYDWNILQQLDLNSYQPAFILFEYHHLSEIEQEAAQAFLQKDYLVFQIGIDLLAVQRKLDAQFLEAIMLKIKLFS